MEYIYRTPWEFLFGTEGTKRAIFFMGEAFLVLILLFSSCGAAEKGGMELIINTSAVGKKEVLMKKTCICMITAIVIYIFAYLPELIGVLGTYGTGSLDACKLPLFRQSWKLIDDGGLSHSAYGG